VFGAYEVITYGGGANYRDIFQAVALMSGTSAVSSLIRLAMLLGLVMTIARGMFDLNAGKALKWFITAAVIYGVFFVPKVTVHITDKLNPGLTGADVANVPIGIAFAEAISSQIGSRAIQMTETAFADPDDVTYSKTGMIYGAKFMQGITKVSFTDALFNQNMSAFMQDCVFYDLADNRYSADRFAKATDVWTYVTVTNPTNPARSMVYVSESGTTMSSEIKTCPQVAALLSANMDAQTKSAAIAMQRRLEPEQGALSDTASWSRVSSQTTTLTGLTGMASTDAMSTIRQLAVLNTLKATIAGNELSPGSALASAQAEVQTHNTQSLLGPIGEKAIVVLKIVIDALFIGIFTVLFPCFLLPTIGTKMLQGYFVGFFYLQLWGPMYVIIHKIIMTAAYAKTAAAAYVPGGTAGFNLQTVGGIGDINSQIQAVASCMILMIPVIAAGLTKGAVAVGQQGDALLQPFRSGAESAAASQTTGNYSFGTTAVNTHNFDSWTGNKRDTARFENTGSFTRNNAQGDMVTTNQNGSVSVRAAGADSAITFDSVSERAASQRTAASLSRERSNTYDNVAANARSQTEQRIREASRVSTTGTESRVGASNESRDSQTQGLGRLSSISSTLVSRYGYTASAAEALTSTIALQQTASAGAESKASVGGRGPVGAGGSLTTGWSGTSSDATNKSLTKTQQQGRDWARNEMASADVRQALDKVETQAINDAWAKTASTSQAFRNSTSTSFASTATFTEQARQARSESARLEQSADQTIRMAETLRGNHGQAFFTWATSGANGGGLRYDAEGNRRSDTEIGNLLQARNERDWGTLQEGYQTFLAQRPAIATPDLVTDNQRDLGPIPTAAGINDAPLVAFDGSKLGRPGDGTPKGRRGGPSAADKRIANSQRNVDLPDLDRNVAPGEELNATAGTAGSRVDAKLSTELPRVKPVTFKGKKDKR